MKRRIGLKIFIGFITFILLIVISCMLDLTRNSKGTLKEFDNVIAESVTNSSAKIIDISMLGAHDAFSNNITTKSAPDYNDGGIVTNKLVRTVAGGLVVRMSRAQIAGTKEMLYAGVRYFDVRITKVEDDYYTYHGYISDKLEVYIKDMITFMKNHPNEFIIFDIQHFYTDQGGNRSLDSGVYIELKNYMDNIKVDNESLMDYALQTTKSIDELTYAECKGKVIMLAKTDEDDTFIDRSDDNIRSEWINKNSDEDMLNGIENEYNYLKTQTRDRLVVCQAQKTGFITDITIIRSLLNWSLINLADNFNKVLVSDEDRFMRWIGEMPIFMVDYSTSSKGDFNDKVIEYIKNYNSQL